MGLQADLQTDIADAFDNDLADAVKNFTIKNNKNSFYNPATGQYTESGLEYPTRGVVSSFTNLEIINSGGAIDRTDKKVIILTNEVSIVPHTDHLLIIDNLEHRILNKRVDPANAAYILQVRQS